MIQPSVATLGYKSAENYKSDQMLRKSGLLRQIWAN